MNAGEQGGGEPFRQGLFEWTAGEGGHLLGTRCERCDVTFFPPRSTCTVCFREDRVVALTLSKRGTLYTYCTVHQSRPGIATPYTIGYVDLPEGVRVFARLVDADPEDFRTGMEMELTFGRLHEPPGEGGPVVYKFRPVRAGLAGEIGHG